MSRPNRSASAIASIVVLTFVALLVLLGWRRASTGTRTGMVTVRAERDAEVTRVTRSRPAEPRNPAALGLSRSRDSLAGGRHDEVAVSSGGRHAGVTNGADAAAASEREAVFRAFRTWVEVHGRTPATDDDARLREGVALARARREVLRELIPGDPRRALAEAVSWATRRQLPSLIEAELERPVAARGRLEVVCATPWPGRPSSRDPFSRRFTPDAARDSAEPATYRAYVYGRRLAQTGADGVVLQGIAVDDLLAVREETVQPLAGGEIVALRGEGRLSRFEACALSGASVEVGASATVVRHGDRLMALARPEWVAEFERRLAAAEPGFRRATEPPAFGLWTHGIKTLIYLRARFPDDLREPVTEAEAAEAMRLANEYFVASSFNNLSIVATIGPLVTLPQPKLYYAVKGPGALIDDAREATRAAGIEPESFDLDAVRFESVPGFDWAGLGAVGGRGVWLQSSALGVLCHELGHNLGLGHANFWNTARPDPPPDTRNLPFDPDGEVGLDSVIGPGDDVEYGDPFDMMGGGGGVAAHFNALHKYLLGWIPESGIRTVTTNGDYRVYAHDAGVLSAGLPLALRVRKDVERQYWIGARSRLPDHPWLSRGVELHWNNWHQAIGTCELLDTTPGSGPGRDDAALTVGRTYVDAAAGVFVTTLARGTASIGGVAVPYYDLAIRLGAVAGNESPTVELTASSLQVGIGEPVVLEAAAVDADGDVLAVSWDFGDGRPGPSGWVVTNAWDQPGDRVVRCEVSDLHGGLASKHLVVRVGQPNGLRLRGRVVDQRGEPLAGVRVHNGRAGTNSLYAPDYRWAYTDSDGSYTLTGLAPGSYGVGATLDGYRIQPLNFARPLILNQFTGVDVDFVAAAVPVATASLVSDGAESPARPAVFRIARSGPTNESLKVFFRLGGSAASGSDYTPWPQTEVQTNVIPTVLQPVQQEIEYGFVELEPGVPSTQVALPVSGDAESEGDETVVLTLSYPVTRVDISETETNYVDIPGWEVLDDNGREAWFQTRPAYRLGARDEAVARIRDADSPAGTVISIVALETAVSENGGDSATFLVTRTGRRPSAPLSIPLVLSGTATPGEDFVAPSSPLILPPEAESMRVVVEILDDRRVEGNELIQAVLGPGDGYVLGAGGARVQIVDNDLPTVWVTATDPVVTERGSGARVTFQRSGDLGRPLEIDYLLGGTATPGADYAALPGRVVLAAGSASGTIVVQPMDDALAEGDETVEVRVGDSPGYNAVTPAHVVVRLRDDEFPSVTVLAADATAGEGDDPGTFVVRRTGSTAGSLLVRYRLAGSAVHQADYVAAGDEVVIPAGQFQTVITVSPIDDAIREDPETIVIELVEGPGYSTGERASAAIELLDNGDSELAVGFALLASRGPESKTAPDLAVRISGNPDEGDENAVTVTWEVLGGSAVPGEDFVLERGTLVFPYADPEGDSPLTNRVAAIPLEVIDDLLWERDENLLVRLRIAPTELPSDDPEAPPTLVTNGWLDVFAVHTYTILDDDLAEIVISAPEPSTAEGSAVPARLVVSRSGRTNAALTVIYHVSGSAAAGNDYVALPGYATIDAGRTSVDLPVVAIDDPLQEFRENVVVTLVSAPGARLGNARRAEARIDDDDGTIEFAAAHWTASEGDGTARIAVLRTGDTNLTATAVFEARPGTAVVAVETNGVFRGDFFPTNGVLVFAPGERRREFEIGLIDDGQVEGPKTIELSLSRGSDLFPLGGQNAAVVTLIDDDALLSTGTNATFGIEVEPVLTLTLERSGPVEVPLSVRFATRDGTATAGFDYVAGTGAVSFAAGERTASLRVGLIDDFVIEGDEVFLVELSEADGNVLGVLEATVVDDDCALQFAVAGTGVDEDAGVVELTVVRVGSPLNPVVASYRTVSDTAIEGVDFSETSGQLFFEGNRFEALTNGSGEIVFRVGETNRLVSVPILNDSEGERDEVFRLELTEARSGHPDIRVPFVRLGSPSNVVVTLRDNEAPGRLDDGFQPGLGADGPVRALGLQRDGKVLIGGDFTKVDGVILPRLARVHADGLLDQSFNPGRGLDGSVLAVAEIAGGRLLAGGTFTNVDGVRRPFLARFEPDGTPAPGTEARPNGVVRAIGIAGSEGAFLIGGDFTMVNGQRRSGVARLGPDGEWDASFQADAGGPVSVRAVAGLDDGGAWVGGDFADWARTGARHLVRLRADGTPDPAFPAALSPNGPVHALARWSDGSIYVAGAFGSIGGTPRSGLARLLASGAVDPGFAPGSGANAPVLAVGVHDGDRVLLAGAFDRFDDGEAGRFARVSSGGGLDPTFVTGTGANDVVRALAVQPDGALVIGGDFTEIQGRPRSRLARIHADEKFVEGFVEFVATSFRAPETQPEVVIEVRRTGSAKTPARVGYATLAGTAEDGADFEPVAGELVFETGRTSATFRVALRDDVLAEGNESLTLILTNAVGATPGRISVVPLIIEDDEAAIAFDVNALTVTEDSGAAALVVRRSGPVGDEATVAFRAETGTAVAGEDFTEIAGEIRFAPGEATAVVFVPIVDDGLIEGAEEFVVRLSEPSSAWALGSQVSARVTIEDDDQLPTHHTLTIQPSPGGVVSPGGGRFPTHSLVQVAAYPDPGFEFARWEGTVVSADNPLSLLMERNHVLTARFRAREYLETFESGDFGRLPWQHGGDAPWSVTDETASGGRFSARSGAVSDSGTSRLGLDFESPAGGGSFDFRTESEAGWDFLEFWLNGERMTGWSGINGWQTHRFDVPAGRNRLEWRFVRDRTFGGSGNRVWIDNLDLPEPEGEGPPRAPRLALVPGTGGCQVRIEGAPNRVHVLEVSFDLRSWSPVASGSDAAGIVVLADPACGSEAARFYRARVE